MERALFLVLDNNSVLNPYICYYKYMNTSKT